MDFAVKMELPKLSHLHIIDMLVPLVPGIIIATGFALRDAPSFKKFWGIELGYKSKLALSVALIYITGMAIMALIEFGNYFLMKCLNSPLQEPHGITPTGEEWRQSTWAKICCPARQNFLLKT